MANEIRALVVRVGQPSAVEMVGATLEAQQKLVGGSIEGVQLGGGVMMICNEEGKLLGLPANFLLPGDVIVGDVFFCRVDNEGECASLTDSDIERIRAKIGR